MTEPRTQLERIHQRKRERITRLHKLNSAVLVYSYYAIVNDVSVSDMNRYFSKTLNVKVNPIDLPYHVAVEKYSVALVKNIRKRTKAGMKPMDIALLALSVMKVRDSYSKLSGMTYQYSRKIEGEEKQKVIDDALNDEAVDVIIHDEKHKESEKGKAEKEEEIQRKLEEADLKAKIFYLASSHDDCAKDHLDWQGKLYYDSEWRSKLKSERIKKEVSSFINKSGMKSFQWVIGKPVWLITRPNCRHYFIQIPVEKAMADSVSDLIKKYKTHTKEGRRKDLQTMKHPTDSGWYTKENVEGIIQRYKERLSYHQALNSVKSTPTLKKAIEKDKLLIKKWTEYLNSHFQ